MKSLQYIVIGFAVVALPVSAIDWFTGLHAVMLGMLLVLVAALLRLDELARVVAESKREIADITAELDALKQQHSDY